jgi:hypothetical protein
MITGGEVELHIQGLTQGSEEMEDELGVPIGGDMSRNSMLGEDMEDK